LNASDDDDVPLIIIGGGREAARPGFEIGVDDDGVVNPAVGRVLRRFLPEVFPDKFVEREPEMEWVRGSLLFLLCARF
jgi:hypothetical protein